MPGYAKRNGEWIRRTGRRAGQPVGPWRSRRLDRKVAKVSATTGWMPPERPDTGGTGGVREPRNPTGPLPTLAATADPPT